MTLGWLSKCFGKSAVADDVSDDAERLTFDLPFDYQWVDAAQLIERWRTRYQSSSGYPLILGTAATVDEATDTLRMGQQDQSSYTEILANAESIDDASWLKNRLNHRGEGCWLAEDEKLWRTAVYQPDPLLLAMIDRPPHGMIWS